MNSVIIAVKRYLRLRQKRLINWVHLPIADVDIPKEDTLDELNKILVREKRFDLYKECLKFVKVRIDLDLALFKDDIWSH